jgi:hypothetical protein
MQSGFISPQKDEKGTFSGLLIESILPEPILKYLYPSGNRHKFFVTEERVLGSQFVRKGLRAEKLARS